jgi:hypothetical protein
LIVGGARFRLDAKSGESGLLSFGNGGLAFLAGTITIQATRPLGVDRVEGFSRALATSTSG